jgi:putative ABC transport system ATP-binding protein
MGEKPLNALRGISLDIHEGDFISIQGPSGSGKSTLMYLLGCLDLPSKGQIFLDGKDISKLSESNLAKIRGQQIGFVFQSFNLVQTLSALENVALPTFFQNISETESTKKALELLKLVGLSERASHHPNQLSGGEQQRVAIARSLINDPPIILADEPTGNLDSKTGHEIMKLLAELHQKYNKTIIIVTHDPEIAHHAEKKVNIIDGQISHDHQLAKRFVWAKNGRRK